MMLIHVDQERALDYLSSCIDQVNSFNEILQLVIVELVYKVRGRDEGEWEGRGEGEGEERGEGEGEERGEGEGERDEGEGEGRGEGES